eukprot:gene2278-2421_t
MFAQDLVESKETFDILIEQDCRETSSFTGPLLDPDPANSIYAPRIEGIDSLVESIGRQYLTVPDIAFQLSDVKVCQRLNTPGSKVVATSMIRGTMLYSIVPTQRSIQDNDHELSSEKEDRSRYEDQVFLEMLDKQLDFCLEGIVTISLDDQHRFISISIEAEKVLS